MSLLNGNNRSKIKANKWTIPKNHYNVYALHKVEEQASEYICTFFHLSNLKYWKFSLLVPNNKYCCEV